MKKTLLVIMTLFLFSIFGFVVYIFYKVPAEKDLRGCFVAEMNQVPICPGSKEYVPLKRISQNVIWAVVASEDGNFWNHHGFDWDSLQKSAEENWQKGSYKRGGSTISQQLAKNLYLSGSKSLWRKGLEAIITRKIEGTLTKREILEKYLNVVEFGPNIYGIKAAANYYFQKTPSEISPAEAAFLAMLLPNPKKYSISFRKKELTPFAKRRMRKILSDMSRSGQVLPDQYEIEVTKTEWMFQPIPLEKPVFTQDELNSLQMDLEPAPTDIEFHSTDEEQEH